MSSPQKENGFTPIANELFEAFYRCKLLEYERCLVMCIWRKTYGWNKKEDWVSNSQIMDETGISLPNISRTIKSLISKKVLSREGKKVCVNKNYEEWVVEWRRLSHQTTKVVSPDNKRLSHERPTKEKKETITKDKPKGMYTYQPVDESGSPYSKKAKSTKSNSAPKEVIALAFFFETESEKVTGVKPDLTKAFFKIKFAMKTHGLTPADVKELFKHFLTDKKIPMETKVSLGFPLSGNYIAQWKVKKNNRPISQVEASLDIKL